MDSSFVSNNSKYITLIIILVLTVVITFNVCDYDSEKEGMKNAKDPSKEIGKAFKKIKNIMDMLKCPITIFKNIKTCSVYWSFDLLFYIIWGIVWVFSYVFIFIPLSIAFFICSITLTKWLDTKLTISMNDVCPSKQTVMNTFENLYQFYFNNKFLYRDKSDIQKCYCAPPLIKGLKPLTNYSSISLKNIPTPTLGNIFVIPCVIFLLFIMINIIYVYLPTSRTLQKYLGNSC